MNAVAPWVRSPQLALQRAHGLVGGGVRVEGVGLEVT